MQHGNNNLLVTGKTGTGKSTSACFAAIRFLRQGRRIRYMKLRRLLDEWRKARISDDRFAVDSFFADIVHLDLLIVDEAAGKTRNTESGQEMLYELLDMLSDGEIQTHIWFLGNFYEGSVVNVFGDDEPVYRRLEENFCCIGLSESGQITRFHVWNASGC